MVAAWILGVYGLSDSFATLLFLREGVLPDVDAMTRMMKDATEPVEALILVQDAARLRSIGQLAQLAFPLSIGKLILSVLLVISSGMAMSGRPGARSLAIQALIANAALSIATFWILRDARYAWLDAIIRVREVLPRLPDSAPPDQQQAWSLMLDRRWWMWVARIRLGVFDVGLLLSGAIALITNKTKSFFDAVAAEVEEAEDP